MVKSFDDLRYVKMRLEMNETMFNNYYLLTKNKNKKLLPEVITANGTHNNKQTRFSMYQDESSIVYIVKISGTYKYHITVI